MRDLQDFVVQKGLATELHKAKVIDVDSDRGVVVYRKDGKGLPVYLLDTDPNTDQLIVARSWARGSFDFDLRASLDTWNAA